MLIAKKKKSLQKSKFRPNQYHSAEKGETRFQKATERFLTVPPGGSENGFPGPESQGWGRSNPATTFATPPAAGPGKSKLSTGLDRPPKARKRPRDQRNREAPDPRDEGLQKGGARAAEVGRATQGGSAARTPPRATAGEGPRVLDDRRHNLLRGLPPRGSRGRHPGLPVGSAGPAHRRGGREGGDTKRDISAQPAPSPRPPPPPRAWSSAPP